VPGPRASVVARTPRVTVTRWPFGSLVRANTTDPIQSAATVTWHRGPATDQSVVSRRFRNPRSDPATPSTPATSPMKAPNATAAVIVPESKFDVTVALIDC